MIKRALWLILMGFLWLFMTRAAFAADPIKPAFHEELGQAWSVLGRELEGLFDRWQEHFGSMGAREEGPPISMIIRNREKLDLSSDQVKNLETVLCHCALPRCQKRNAAQGVMSSQRIAPCII